MNREAIFALMCAALIPGACDDFDPTTAPQASDTQERATEPPPWVEIDRHQAVAIIDDELEQELATATQLARDSAEEARMRWQGASPDERMRWAIKWAAPTETGEGIEYIWMRPAHWSPFRIEGPLLSQPVNVLKNHPSQGDLIAFSSDELVDWVILPRPATNDEREGGFTIDVLDRRAESP